MDMYRNDVRYGVVTEVKIPVVFGTIRLSEIPAVLIKKYSIHVGSITPCERLRVVEG